MSAHRPPTTTPVVTGVSIESISYEASELYRQEGRGYPGGEVRIRKFAGRRDCEISLRVTDPPGYRKQRPARETRCFQGRKCALGYFHKCRFRHRRPVELSSQEAVDKFPKNYVYCSTEGCGHSHASKAIVDKGVLVPSVFTCKDGDLSFRIFEPNQVSVFKDLEYAQTLLIQTTTHFTNKEVLLYPEDEGIEPLWHVLGEYFDRWEKYDVVAQMHVGTWNSDGPEAHSHVRLSTSCTTKPDGLRSDRWCRAKKPGLL